MNRETFVAEYETSIVNAAHCWQLDTNEGEVVFTLLSYLFARGKRRKKSKQKHSTSTVGVKYSM